MPSDLASRYSIGVSNFLSKFPDNPTLDFDRSDAQKYVALRRDEGAKLHSIKSDLNAFDSFRTWVMQNVAGSLIAPAAAASKRFQGRSGRPPITLDDLRSKLQRRYGWSAPRRTAENASPEQTPSMSEDSTPAMSRAKAKAIERSKARWTRRNSGASGQSKRKDYLEPEILDSNAYQSASTIDVARKIPWQSMEWSKRKLKRFRPG